MKLTVVTATFNCIRSGNREKLVRCIESVAKLKTPHEHLIYDGASSDGTVDLIREVGARLENSSICRFVDSSNANPQTFQTTQTLKLLSEPDTGIYNALNKGVRDAQGEWFYVLGADDYICNPEVLDRLIADGDKYEMLVAPIVRDKPSGLYQGVEDLWKILWRNVYSHQSVIMRTPLVRRFDGFDESYKICADWHLLMKCHAAAVPINYTTTPIAFYTCGGASEQGPIGHLDHERLHREFLEMTEEEWEAFCELKCWALMKGFKFAFHRDLALRMSGRRTLWIFAKNILRILLWPAVIFRRRFILKRVDA